MTTSIFRRHEHVRDPNLPTVKMGGSKTEVLYLVLGLAVLALIAIGFWFQATH